MHFSKVASKLNRIFLNFADGNATHYMKQSPSKCPQHVFGPIPFLEDFIFIKKKLKQFCSSCPDETQCKKRKKTCRIEICEVLNKRVKLRSAMLRKIFGKKFAVNMFL